MALSKKRRKFVEEYLNCWNATEAARRAGYAHPHVMGSRLRKVKEVEELISSRLKEAAMSADEVMSRLADIARADIGDFMDVGKMHFNIDLDTAKEKGLTHLIKKVKQRTVISGKDDTETHYQDIELLDQQRALEQIGRAHGIFKDRTVHEGELSFVVNWDENGADRDPGEPASGAE